MAYDVVYNVCSLAIIKENIIQKSIYDADLEAMRNEPHLFLEESADLLFHYLILLRAKGVELNEVLAVLKGRMG